MFGSVEVVGKGGVVSRSAALEAFKTTGSIIAALQALPERDEAIDALIESIEETRARLMASLLCVPGREPARVREPGMVP